MANPERIVRFYDEARNPRTASVLDEYTTREGLSMVRIEIIDSATRRGVVGTVTKKYLEESIFQKVTHNS